MKVKQLNLANFRGFEQIELEFEPDVNVIAGVNGVGKSAILQALATLLSHVLREVTPSRSKALTFASEDIREGQNALVASTKVLTDSEGVDVSILRSRPDPEVAASARGRLKAMPARKSEAGDDEGLQRELIEEERYLRSLLNESHQMADVRLTDVRAEQVRTGELDAATRAEQRSKQQLRRRPNQPLALFFSPQRQLITEVRSQPRSKPLSLSSAYQSALESRPLNLHHFVYWYRMQKMFASERGGRRQQILDALQRAVTDFIPEFKALRVEEKPSFRFVVEKAGVPLALNQLSDGERGLLVIIFDITRRLAIANPELDDPIAQGKAIVLIDEIELHLHPEWQRKVLRRFTETFKKCQFIVTTHSPQVVGEVESRCLRFLLHEDGKIAPWTPPRSLGLDSSRVLEELMDVRARNEKIEDDLKVLFRLIDEEDFEEAKKRIEELQTVLGENDPELTRARSLMAFLEGAE